MSSAAALGLLEASGFQVDTNTSVSPAPSVPDSTTTSVSTGPPEVIRGRISKDGEQLTLVIGVAANDPTSVAVANTAADQLRDVGIAATVLALDPVTLYHDALNDNRVDAIAAGAKPAETWRRCWPLVTAVPHCRRRRSWLRMRRRRPRPLPLALRRPPRPTPRHRHQRRRAAHPTRARW